MTDTPTLTPTTLSVTQAILVIETAVARTGGGEISISITTVRQAVKNAKVRGYSKLTGSDPLSVSIDELARQLAPLNETFGAWLTLDRETELIAMADTFVHTGELMVMAEIKAAAVKAGGQEPTDEPSEGAEPPADDTAAIPIVGVVEAAAANVDDDFVESELGLVPAGNLALELGISVDEVLGHGMIFAGGTPSTLVDRDQVMLNIEVAEAGVLDTEPASAATVAVYDTAVERSILTSDQLRLDRTSRMTIDAIVNLLERYWPRVFSLNPYRVPGNELRGVERDGAVVAYEYDNPLLDRHVTRISPRLAAMLIANPQEPFPLLDPALMRQLVRELASLSIALNVCNACGGQLDQFMPSKLKHVLEGKYYLRGAKGRTVAALKALGRPTEGLEELRFKRNHVECNALLKAIHRIVMDMRNEDFGDEAVIAAFTSLVTGEVKSVYVELRQGSRARDLTLKVVHRRAIDITDRLLEGAGI